MKRISTANTQARAIRISQKPSNDPPSNLRECSILKSIQSDHLIPQFKPHLNHQLGSLVSNSIQFKHQSSKSTPEQRQRLGVLLVTKMVHFVWQRSDHSILNPWGTCCIIDILEVRGTNALGRFSRRSCGEVSTSI